MSTTVHNRPQPSTTVHLLLSIILAGSLMLSFSVGAQPLFCGVDQSCAPFESGFKCATTGTISALSTGIGAPFLDAVTAQTTPQKVVVNGFVIFDQDYTFASGSEIVFAEGAGFIVNPAKTLALNLSNLKGCQKLWEGIRVEYTGKIFLSVCTISDAKIAVDLRSGFSPAGAASGISSVGCFYVKNEIGIRIGDLNSFARKFEILRGGITGNVFVGGKLLGTNLRAKGGIEIANTSPLTIGGQGINQFKDYNYSGEVYGMKITNSSAQVSFSYFSKIGDLASAGNNGWGIYFNSGLGTEELRYSGIPNSNFVNFDKVGTSILQYKGHLKTLDLNSQGSRYGIVYNGAGAVPSSIELNRFHIENYQSAAVTLAGIPNISNLFIGGIATILDNNLIDNNMPGRYGVYIEGTGPTPLDLKHGNVQAIDFTNGFKSNSPIESYGIVVRNASNGVIHGNQIIDANNTSSPNPAGTLNGISIESSEQIEVENNQLAGISNNPSEGITLLESNNTAVTCNNIYRYKKGLSISGVGCHNAAIRTNSFGINAQGLYLDNTATLGVQPAHENTWADGNTGAEAYYNFPGFDPNNVLDRLRVQMSSFLINDPNQTSQYWPNPRSISGTPDNNIWFAYDQNYAPPSGDDPCAATTCCPGGGGVSGNAAQRIVSGTYPAFGQYPALLWEAERNLYMQFKQHPEQIGANPTLSNWFEEKSGSSLGRLQDVYEAVANLAEPQGALKMQLDQAYSGLANLQNQIFGLDEQIIGAATEEVASPLSQQRNVLLDAAIVAQENYQALALSHEGVTRQQAAQLLTELRAIPMATLWEQHFKEVLDIWLQVCVSGETLNDEQKVVLESIANECRYTGGYGVEMARRMLPRQTYQDNPDCGSNMERILSAVDLKDCGTLFPNPANMQTILRLDKPVISGKAVIADALGRTLQSCHFSGNEKIFDLSSLHPGVYYLSLQCDGKTFKPHRITVVR